ncbi:hypothetical protein NDU88_006755 [Pleurodeles waltl]|uniref:Uncharacterized protein n=1 Tax=Pleurodeles waltl TaxID=8319 RepID=A0AAV7RPV5_PLEWA|nr:hypothetical protein NDU88_006755 [Pleurodeles waltl]
MKSGAPGSRCSLSTDPLINCQQSRASALKATAGTLRQKGPERTEQKVTIARNIIFPKQQCFEVRNNESTKAWRTATPCLLHSFRNDAVRLLLAMH